MAKTRDVLAKTRDVLAKTRDVLAKTRDVLAKTRDVLAKTRYARLYDLGDGADNVRTRASRRGKSSSPANGYVCEAIFRVNETGACLNRMGAVDEQNERSVGVAIRGRRQA